MRHAVGARRSSVSQRCTTPREGGELFSKSPGKRPRTDPIRLSNPPTRHSGKPRWATQFLPGQSLQPEEHGRASVHRSMFAAVIVVAGGSSLMGQGAMAQWWNLPDGIDNPRPRYYDYHPPGVFYGDPGPVGFAASGFLAAPLAASPPSSYGSAGYGYLPPPYAAPSVALPVAPRPLCGVYRYWRDGICVDRRGY